ncbi:CHAT domain-containing protein [Thermomonospora umbrina]|uniref:CHAT domain-containing protein n=1 Tax=Thermomonospora umbrina TaxID=111806 RepID=A0A3D9SNC5_9ACTN|nr:CHAT domain-containing protein [Thermomonospora umbrina]REE97207.1 CHAT domain-containing protein [Thermomonospora umbrina]
MTDRELAGDGADEPLPWAAPERADRQDELRARFEQTWASMISFAYHGGPPEDRDAALAGFGGFIDLDVAPDRCRVLSAFLTVIGEFRPEYRGGTLTGSDLAALAADGLPLSAESAARAGALLDEVTDPDLTEDVDRLRVILALAGVGEAVRAGAAIDGPELASMHERLNGLRTLFADGQDVDSFDLMSTLLRTIRTAEDEGTIHEMLAGALRSLDGDHLFRPTLERALTMVTAPPASPVDDWTAPRERLAAEADRLEIAFRVLAEDDPDRVLAGLRAATARGRLLMHDPSEENHRRAIAVLDAVETTTVGEHARLAAVLRGSIDGCRAMLLGGGTESSAAIEALLAGADDAALDPHLRDVSLGMSASLLAMRYQRLGRTDDLDAAVKLIRRVTEREDLEDAEYSRLLRYFLATSKIANAADRALPETFAAALTEVQRFEEQPGPLTRTMGFRLDRSVLEMFARAVGPDGVDLEHARAAGIDGFEEEAERMLTDARAMPPDHPLFLVNLGLVGAYLVQAGFVGSRLDLLDRGIAILAEARREAVRQGGGWTLANAQPLFGFALLLRYELSGRRDHLDDAIGELRAGTGLLEEQGDDIALASILYRLGEALRRRGDMGRRDPEKAVAYGIRYLREAAWQVVLQSTPRRSADAAAEAAGDATEVARWALACDRDASAVEALELGRNMVLYTATAYRNLADILADHGHDALAEEWRREQNDAPAFRGSGVPLLSRYEVPGDLRQRIRRVTRGTDLEDKLWSRTGPTEIATALAEARADALVYLIPGRTRDGAGRDVHHPGLALIVDAAGDVHRLPLPDLWIDPVGAFAAAQRDRVARRARRAPDRPSDRVLWRASLAELCRWAWTAVMSPLLDWTAGRGLVRARLVLVPLEGLSQVPWHAAVRSMGGVDRAACQDAVLSYAASGRQFVEACRIRPRPWTESPALVNVDDSGLYWASEEVEALRRDHYPTARVLDGRSRRDRARAAAVAELITEASLVHLSCHASPEPLPVESELILVGEERLRMADLLARAAQRPADRPGGLVVAAACGTDLSQTAHDESLTLTSAFLASGACGAVGSRWIVDDLPAAVVMALFHHYLNSGYPEPARALQAAQARLLDPGGGLPPRVAELFAGELDDISLSTPEVWAAFVYQGR